MISASDILARLELVRMHLIAATDEAAAARRAADLRTWLIGGLVVIDLVARYWG